jgi:protein-disulfide isomerase
MGISGRSATLSRIKTSSGYRSILLSLALDLSGRLGQELAGGVHAGRVRRDFDSGVRSGVNGTPTFFINGKRHDGPSDFDSLAGAIAAELAQLETPS